MIAAGISVSQITARRAIFVSLVNQLLQHLILTAELDSFSVVDRFLEAWRFRVHCCPRVMATFERDRLAHSKSNLPTKICDVCQRPFAWRKKWARDWDAVRYCSAKCRTASRRQGNFRCRSTLTR